MVYFSGLESVIESIYLEDRLGNKVGECDVFVNPTNTKYLVGKTIIINSLTYPENEINILLGNGNKVVTRISVDVPGIIFQPYIIRVSSRLMYNGKEVSGKVEIGDLLRDYCFYDNTLYFPKLNPKYYPVLDLAGNLTGIGWALHQVGVLVKDDLEFKNLDIIKLKKFSPSKIV
jgi:hypothetical protein